MFKSNSLFILIIFSLISFTTYCQQAQNPEITAEEIKQHISYLASDELKGRDSGSKEIKEAADYITNEFKDYGLEPIFDGSYLQEFPFIKTIELSDKNSLTISFGENKNHFVVSGTTRV